MTALKATPEFYDALHGYRKANSELRFVKDKSGNNVVGLRVLEDPAFAAIHDELNALERIEYLPPEPEGPDEI